MARLIGLLLLLTLACTACGEERSSAHPGADPKQVDSTEVPAQKACRNLTRADLERPDNASRTVPCTDPHNAETYAAGDLPEEFDDVTRTDADLAAWAYDTCDQRLRQHLATTESVLMRSMLSWVWFSPSENAWEDGARWFRCDVVGGGQAGAEHVDLPTSTRSLLGGKVDDRWTVCARGRSVNGEKVPCSEQHDWRAVSTIKVGSPKGSYPGEEKVAATTKSYCAESVDAWLGYPEDFDYGYTWFGQAEWDTGNRLSVCWARTQS